MDTKRYRVQIRREIGLQVKLEAEQLDGKVYAFTPTFRLHEDEFDGKYFGEYAMVPADDQGWPEDAPTWIASGDLVEVKE